jgi:hypothetical protein
MAAKAIERNPSTNAFDVPVTPKTTKQANGDSHQQEQRRHLVESPRVLHGAVDVEHERREHSGQRQHMTTRQTGVALQLVDRCRHSMTGRIPHRSPHPDAEGGNHHRHAKPQARQERQFRQLLRDADAERVHWPE